MTNRKQKGGMGLPSYLLPIGFIVARAAAPKIVRLLKKTFSKQMGGKKQRKIRTKGKRKNKRKTRRSSRSRRQRGGTIEGSIEALYIEAGATNDMFQNDVDHMKKHYPGQLHVLLKYAKQSVSDALENTTIALEAKSAKSPKRKRRTKKKPRRPRRTRRQKKRKTSNKKSKHHRCSQGCGCGNTQKGGFMRGSTRNFCTLNK